MGLAQHPEADIQPPIHIRVNGIPHPHTDALVSLRLTDEAGIQADVCEMQWSEHWPALGDEIEVVIGPSFMGVFVVDEWAQVGPPDQVHIKAKATPMVQSLRAPTSRTWNEITLQALVAAIAAQHGLKPAVDATLGEKCWATLQQTQESDLHLLTRLTKGLGAMVKPVMGRLVVMPRGQAKSVTGIPLNPIEIPTTDIIQYRFAQTEHYRFRAVQARWFNPTLAQEQSVMAGEGQPVYTLRHPFNEKAEAIAQAQATLDALNRGRGELHLTVLGRGDVMAEGRIQLDHPALAGAWSVQRVAHHLDGQGFKTRLVATIPSL